MEESGRRGWELNTKLANMVERLSGWGCWVMKNWLIDGNKCGDFGGVANYLVILRAICSWVSPVGEFAMGMH